MKWRHRISGWSGALTAWVVLFYMILGMIDGFLGHYERSCSRFLCAIALMKIVEMAAR